MCLFCQGYTNQFHVSSRSEMALRYNGGAVLEKHHCNTAFVILKRQDCGMLQSLPQRLQTQVRDVITLLPSLNHNDVVIQIQKVIIQYIMGTDMFIHEELVSELLPLELPKVLRASLQ